MTGEDVPTAPPLARRERRELVSHGHTRVDEYFWLRDDERSDPEVLAYLEAENAWLGRELGHTAELQQALYRELVSRLDPRESSVPACRRGHYYYVRYEPERELRIFARRIGSEDGPEEVLLDENLLGEAFEYFRIGSYEVSPDDAWLAWTEDTVSRRQFDLRLRSLRSGEVLAEVVHNVTPSLAFADDGRTLFYVRRDAATLRACQVWRHVVGTPVSADVLVYEETDPAFSLALWRSRDERWIVLYAGSTLSTEVRLLAAGDPAGAFAPVLAREPDHEYSAEPLADMVYIASNRGAPNFRILRAPVGGDGESWEEVVGHRDDVLIEDFAVFDGHLVVEETHDAAKGLRIVPLDGSPPWRVADGEAACVTVIGDNPVSDTAVLRYEYASPSTPDTVYDLDMRTGERRLRKRAFAGEGFDPDRYAVERLRATARDGTAVPVTLLRRAQARADGSHPLYLLGYGAYGAWYEPDFRRDVLSLVDRGCVFAIAHVRGGQELGRSWYEAGKLLHKRNTFTDFIDVADFLVGAGWAHPRRVVGTGRSAGGLLVGAVANMAPHRFAALVTEVPFVDVVTTMLDESIPLTTFEYDEWGNPAERRFYDYMLSYSPYDQVRRQDYPPMLVSTGLWDSQVQYWEPAKWVARLRRMKTDGNRLLLYTDMNAGHGGGSGRFQRQRDIAREYAFILDTLGMGDAGGSQRPAP